MELLPSMYHVLDSISSTEKESQAPNQNAVRNWEYYPQGPGFGGTEDTRFRRVVESCTVVSENS